MTEAYSLRPNRPLDGRYWFYSLSDTQFFWITASWLLLFPAVMYGTFYIARATWKELAVYCLLEVAVLAFKYAKYIHIKHSGTELELTKEER